MAWKAHNIIKGLRGGSALLLGAILISSCAAPQYRYITDASDKAYFKVPYGWKQVSSTELCNLIMSTYSAKICPGWRIAYEEGGKAAAGHYLADNLSHPFVFAQVMPYVPPSTGGALNDQYLESYFLAFSAMEPAALAAQGSGGGLPNLKLQGLQPINSPGGFHGLREQVKYTFPDGVADTFDADALTNSSGSLIYFLVVQCTAACYSQDKAAIDTVMTSFTVRSH